MSDPLRLLFVEDSSEDADLAQRELRNAGLVFTAQRVETAADCLKALRDGPPDAVLADFTLPELDALAVIEMVKSEAPGTPVLVITGTVGDALHQAESHSFDGFAISDISSYLDDVSYRDVFEQVVRTGRVGARLCSRGILYHRELPAGCARHIRREVELEREFARHDAAMVHAFLVGELQ